MSRATDFTPDGRGRPMTRQVALPIVLVAASFAAAVGPPEKEPSPTARNVMDTLDTRQEAFLRLARHYRDKGDFKKALGYFTRWEPQSWCGTCLASMRAERERETALCRLRLGQHAAVVRDRLHWLQKEDGLAGFDTWLLWRLYRDAGQLGDLRQMLDHYEKARK